MANVHFRIRLFASLTLLAAMPGASSLASAQDRSRLIQPQVITSGSAEIVVPATNASFSIDVSSLAPAAATASDESSRIAKSVSNALRAAKLQRDEIAESRLGVGPQWRYDEHIQQSKLVGYEAVTSFRIETEHLDRIGTYIVAALNAGATSISDITFSAKDPVEARRQALSQAIAQARADAETMAHAGGGSLGELLLLTTEPTRAPIGYEEVTVTGARRARDSVSPVIVPTQIEVTARVVGHWKFVPSTRAQ